MDVELSGNLDERDPAAEAFARLEGEMALVRRAVEHLAAEKAAITIPDYSTTLGEMARRLGAIARSINAIADQPAMQFTPEGLAARIDAAAQGARRTDHAELTEARRRFDQASQDMRGLVTSARAAAHQRRRLYQVSGAGMLAGVLLWVVLPGIVARAAPESWQWPERMAARTLRLDKWSAGEHLLAKAEPERWQTVLLANRILQDNREVIAKCRRTGEREAKTEPCSIFVSSTYPSE